MEPKTFRRDVWDYKETIELAYTDCKVCKKKSTMQMIMGYNAYRDYVQRDRVLLCKTCQKKHNLLQNSLEDIRKRNSKAFHAQKIYKSQ